VGVVGVVAGVARVVVARVVLAVVAVARVVAARVNLALRAPVVVMF